MQRCDKPGPPPGSVDMGPHPLNPELEWVSHPLWDRPLLYCRVCRCMPTRSGWRGKRGAIALHRHTDVCAFCLGPRRRVSSAGGGSLSAKCAYEPCSNCAAVVAAPVPAVVAATPPPVTVGNAVPGAIANAVGDFVGLGGMRDDRPGPVHSDAVRCGEVRRLLGPLTKVVCLSNGVTEGTEGSGTVFAEFRDTRTWFNRRDPEQSIAGRGITIFLLDYFWLPGIYYRNGEMRGDGYGGRWFSRTLPLFFKHGGQIAILPNDNGGELRNMISNVERVCSRQLASLGVHMLTVEDADACHPLYVATARVTGADGCIRGAGVSHQGGRDNSRVLEEYLDIEHPFCMVYNTGVFGDASAALSKLKSLI